MRPIPLTRPKPSSSVFLLLLVSCAAAAFSMLVMVDPMERRASRPSPSPSPTSTPLRNVNAEAHLADAIGWLLRNESEDGTWSSSGAFAALALVEAGADRSAVKRGVDALLRTPAVGAPALLAVARAAVLLDDAGYRASAAKLAPELLARSKIAGGDPAETAWVGDALWAAREAGASFDADAVGRDIRCWLDSVGEGGQAGEHETLAAIGLSLRLQIGKDAGAPVLATAVQRIACDLPVGSSPDFLYWYHGTQALMQCRQSQPAVWAKWSERVVRVLVEHQRSDERAKGAWDPVGKEGDRVWATAVNAITLARIVKYRSSIAVEHD